MLGELLEWLILDRLFRKLSNSVRVEARIDKITGEALLEYSTAMKTTTIVLSSLFALVFVLMYYAPRPQSTSDIIGELLIISLFLFLGGFSVYYALVETRGCYRLSKEGISRQRPFFKDRFIRWDEIVLIDVSILHQSVVVCSLESKMHFSVFLNGLRDLGRALNNSAPAQARVKAAELIEALMLGDTERIAE